ncbi:hypothetical protein DV737_g4609, partial [Chaetothyriales sp. CBS 132003]
MMPQTQQGQVQADLDNGGAPEQIGREAEGSKRPAAEEDVRARSPKRPRLSPIEDVAPAEVKDSHTGGVSLPPGESGLNQAAVPVPHHAAAALDNGLAVQGSGSTQDASPGTAAPSHQTRLDNLPVLSSLAGQLLSALAKMAPGEGLMLIRNLHLANYQEYRTIRSLLDPVLGLYRTGPSFLIHTQLGMTTASQVEILRKANQAVWLASIFTGEVGLRDMNQSFLFVFVPEQGKLAKNQGHILLELKTQAFITAHRLRAADPRVVLADLFSSDMDQQILSRRSGGQALAPSEQEFLKRLGSRRDMLEEQIRLNKLDELELRYGWSEFSKEISNYIYKTYGNGVAPLARAYEVATEEHAAKAETSPAAQQQPGPSAHVEPAVASEGAAADGEGEGVVDEPQEPQEPEELKELNQANGQSSGGGAAADGTHENEMADTQPRSQETVNGTAGAAGAAASSSNMDTDTHDTTLREFLGKMDEYAPIIPDAVTAHYLTLAGLPPPDPADPTGATAQATPLPLARLLALATQKFISDVAADAYQYSRTRASNTSAGSNPLGTAAPAQAGPGGLAGAASGKAAQQTTQLGVQRSGFGGGGQGGSGQGRTVLTMEDLGMAVQEYGVNVKRGEFYR